MLRYMLDVHETEWFPETIEGIARITNVGTQAVHLALSENLGWCYADRSLACYECGKPAPFNSVDKWTPEGMTIIVPTCGKHTKCPTCDRVMEVNPLNLHVECFLHG